MAKKRGGHTGLSLGAIADCVVLAARKAGVSGFAIEAWATDERIGLGALDCQSVRDLIAEIVS